MSLNTRCESRVAQILEYLDLDLFEVFARVEVFHVVGTHVQTVVWSKVLVVFVHRYLYITQACVHVSSSVRCKAKGTRTLTRAKFLPRSETGLVRPRSADVAHGVAASAKQQQRKAERFDIFDTVGVPCINRKETLNELGSWHTGVEGTHSHLSWTG